MSDDDSERQRRKDLGFPFHYGMRPPVSPMSLAEIVRLLEGIPKYTVITSPGQFETIKEVLAGLPHVRVKSSDYVPAGKAFVIDEAAAKRSLSAPLRISVSELFNEGTTDFSFDFKNISEA